MIRPPIPALTGMRAALILWIVLYHLQPEISFLLPSQPLSQLAAAGFVGVDFFFITSGFIIAYNYAARLFPFNLKRYKRFLGLRIARLYPMHLFSLLLVVLMLGAASITGSTVSNPALYSFSGLVQNLFLVQAWTLPTTFSWNAVSWAVSSEWMAYLAFPLIIAATLRMRSIPIVLSGLFLLLWGMTASCLLLDLSWQAPYGAGSYGLLRVAGEFTSGCLLYNLYTAQWGKGQRLGLLTHIAWAVAVIGSVVIVAHGKQANAVDDVQTFQLYALWLTPLYALAIYALAWQRGALAKLFCSPLVVTMGEMSYALYLTHFIVLIFLRRAVPAESFADANLMFRGLMFCGYLAVMMAVATITYRLVEEPGRLMVKNWLPKKTVPSGSVG